MANGETMNSIDVTEVSSLNRSSRFLCSRYIQKIRRFCMMILFSKIVKTWSYWGKSVRWPLFKKIRSSTLRLGTSYQKPMVVKTFEGETEGLSQIAVGRCWKAKYVFQGSACRNYLCGNVLFSMRTCIHMQLFSTSLTWQTHILNSSCKSRKSRLHWTAWIF